MSQTKAEASRKRRIFSEEFKQDAVRLVVNEDYSFAAAAQAGGRGLRVKQHGIPARPADALR